MRKRSYLHILIVSIIAFVAPLQSFGSDLTLAHVCICRPTDINEAMVKECALQYPATAKRAYIVWSQWQERNAADAKKAIQQCSDVLQELYPTQMSDDAQNEIELLKSEILKTYPQLVKSQGEIFCNEYLTRLENGDNDLRRYLNE
jgi:gas vesicle protein